MVSINGLVVLIAVLIPGQAAFAAQQSQNDEILNTLHQIFPSNHLYQGQDGYGKRCYVKADYAYSGSGMNEIIEGATICFGSNLESMESPMVAGPNCFTFNRTLDASQFEYLPPHIDSSSRGNDTPISIKQITK